MQSAIKPRRIFTISTRRAIARPNRTRRLSKSPKAVIARARFVRFPECAARFVRRRFGSILKEAEDLAKQGVKEIVLIAQDSSQFRRRFGRS